MNSRLTGKAKDVFAKITLAEHEILKQFFQQLYVLDGYSLDFSLIVLDNLQSFKDIEPSVEFMMNSAAQVHPRQSEYDAKQLELIQRFVDRDAQGNEIVGVDGEPQITDMQIEFNEAMTALNLEYEDVIHFNPELTKDEIMAKELEMKLTLPMNFGDIPNQVPPVVVAIFERFY